MSLAQRLAWFEALSTSAIVIAMLALPRPAAQDPAALLGIAARAALVVAVCSAAFYFNDLYEFDTSHNLFDLFGRLCRALGFAALLLGGTYLLFPQTMIPGNSASDSLLILLGTILLVRVTFYGLVKRRPFSERVLVLGGGSLAAELERQIRMRPDLALTCVGFLDDDDEAAGLAGPRLGTYRDVADAVARCRPDRIVVAPPDASSPLPIADLLACRVRGIVIEEGTQTFERLTRRLAVESLSPSALVFGGGFRVSRTYVWIKRAMSVVIATVALAVAAPFLALIALVIKLESSGPVFFVQKRVGLRGRLFPLIKFRTMRTASATDDAIWERDNRSRVTRFGAVLRKYRLDETPQFINILRGDMSLVGPRPEMASNVTTFADRIPYYDLRHEVRPGLTGWAQVKAGYSMSVEEVTQKLCYDLYYIKHMSLRFDLRILFDTVKFVLCGKRPG
ncbi:MAG TPA: sugar transferase [Candidatus Acidoferrum sp.]|nr:sugar transferase [Candidatus Acidoferrum sp.]